MEDVITMRQVGTEESYLLLVDSAQRNMTIDKEPNQYDVVFTTPFQNVIGVDIVTANIPRTQYIVDTDSNTLTLSMNGGATWTTVAIDTGDYAITSFIDELNTVLTQQGLPIQVQSTSNPASQQNKVQMYSSLPFSINMSASGLRRALGFNSPPTAAGAAVSGYALPADYIETDPDVFVATPGLVSGVSATPTYSGPQASSGDATLPLSSTVFVRQRFVAASAGSLVTVVVYATVQGTLPPSDELINFSVVDEQGTVCATGIISIPLPLASGFPTYSSASVASDVMLAEGATYYSIFYDADVLSDGTTNCYNLYATTLLSANSSGNVGVSTGSDISTATWQPYSNPSDDLCVGLQVSPSIYQLTSPGLVDLTGERYINIRCPQIEDYMFKSRAYEQHNIGMAKIDLGVFGYSDTRFDFSSLPPRRFHPIGRVTRLTFQFQRPDGKLYNFYGIDHTMILSMRYLIVDESKTQSTIKLLNPSYDPYLQRYTAGHLLNNPESSDDE